MQYNFSHHLTTDSPPEKKKLKFPAKREFKFPENQKADCFLPPNQPHS